MLLQPSGQIPVESATPARSGRISRVGPCISADSFYFVSMRRHHGDGRSLTSRSKHSHAAPAPASPLLRSRVNLLRKVVFDFRGLDCPCSHWARALSLGFANGCRGALRAPAFIGGAGSPKGSRMNGPRARAARPYKERSQWRNPAGHGVHRSNLNAAGTAPYSRLFPTRAARAADRKLSRSPSSTAWMLLVSTSVRRSFTIW